MRGSLQAGVLVLAVVLTYRQFGDYMARVFTQRAARPRRAGPEPPTFPGRSLGLGLPRGDELPAHLDLARVPRKPPVPARPMTRRQVQPWPLWTTTGPPWTTKAWLTILTL